MIGLAVPAGHRAPHAFDAGRLLDAVASAVPADALAAGWSAVLVPFGSDWDVAPLRDLLGVEERAELARLRGPRAVEFAVGRTVLRALCAAVTGTDPAGFDVHRAAHGRPAVRRAGVPALDANLSHADGVVLAGVTAYGTIGVDVERVRASRDDVARRYFHPDEWNQLAALPADERADAFTHVWVAKEACLKAVGTGLRTPLHDVLVTLAPAGQWAGVRWQVGTPSAGVKAAVALRGLTTSPTC